MKYIGMPMGMWVLFAPSFRNQLTAVFGYGTNTAKAITKKAKPKYREIISELPEFEKGDRFKMNLVNCAMISAFILSMPERPKVDRLTDYYAKSMMTKPMKWFCRKSGKSKFTEKDIAGMKATAALKAADRNPYSWNMEFYEYPDGSGYEGRFTKCGICVLMKKLGLYDLTPALCRLDYTIGTHQRRHSRRVSRGKGFVLPFQGGDGDPLSRAAGRKRPPRRHRCHRLHGGGDQHRSLREERLFPFREEETVRSFRCRHRGHRFDIYILSRRTIIMKKLGLFAAGVLFGTAGIKLLGSKDAKKVYAHTTAAALRAKEGVMKTVTAVREGAEDVYADAKAINERRAEAEAAAVVEDASAEESKAE